MLFLNSAGSLRNGDLSMVLLILVVASAVEVNAQVVDVMVLLTVDDVWCQRERASSLGGFLARSEASASGM